MRPVRRIRATGRTEDLSTGAAKRVAVPSRATDRQIDPFSDHRRLLVLPEPKHDPPQAAEAFACVPVPRYVRSDLPSPVPCIRLRRHEMLRTPVPIAPVDEHRDAATREHDVRPAPQVLAVRGVVSAVTQARSVEKAAHSQLRPGFAASVSQHRPPRILTARRGRTWAHPLTLGTPPLHSAALCTSQRGMLLDRRRAR